MGDEEYVRELFAILTNPSPTRIDPANPRSVFADRIDREGAFGREVRVTSATVVPGEHGAQVEVGFVLELPDDPDLEGVPAEGSIRLPVAAEWRAASNYGEPTDYAWLVAHKVEMAIHGHVRAHQPPRPARPDLPGRDDQWAELLEHLGHEGTVEETSPGRIEVTLDGDEVLTVLVTPEQWEQVLLENWTLHDYFIDLLGPRKRDEQFIVFWEGDLERSVREDLPPVRPWRPMPFVPGGGWYAYPPDTEGQGADSGPSPMGS